MSASDKRKEMEGSINNFRANAEHFEMTNGIIAKMFWQRYKALQAEGFTEPQAFEIIIKRGLD